MTLPRLRSGRLSPCGGRERVGDAGEVLHGAVVEIGRDLAALDVARFEGPVQQQLSFPQPHAQAARERPGDRDLHELQHQQRAERDRSKAAPQPAAVLRDERVAVVGLEQQPLPRGRADREVDLEQLAVRALVAVLRLRQVAHLGFDRARVDGANLTGAQHVGLADEAWLVGVEDVALAVPDLHPHERVVEHVARTTRSNRAIAAFEPESRPSVTAGSTRFCALMTADDRASVIASRSPIRRLATAVASPTMTSTIAPANANWPTWIATTRRSATRARDSALSSTAASRLVIVIEGTRPRSRAAGADKHRTAPESRARRSSDRRTCDTPLAGPRVLRDGNDVVDTGPVRDAASNSERPAGRSRCACAGEHAHGVVLDRNIPDSDRCDSSRLRSSSR